MLVDIFGNGISIAGKDRFGTSKPILTDSLGRTKISHGQPDPIVGSITAVNQNVFASIDSLSDAVFYLYGTYGASTVAFEQSPDSTNGTDGNWFATTAVLQSNGVPVAAVTANSSLAARISAPGAAYVRVRASAFAGGTLNIQIVPTTAATAPQVSTVPTGTQAVSGAVNATLLNVNASVALTAVNLAANATYTGTAIDNGNVQTVYATRSRPMIMHTAGAIPGHLVLQESADNVTWRETRRTPIPSDPSYRTFDWPVHMRYYRYVFINGTAAQTGFYLAHIAVRGEGSSLDTQSNMSFLLNNGTMGAAGVFTSVSLDLGDNHTWDTMRWRVDTTQPGTLALQSSVDGVNWAASTANTIATTAGLQSGEKQIIERFQRAIYTNGATSATVRLTVNLVSL